MSDSNRAQPNDIHDTSPITNHRSTQRTRLPFASDDTTQRDKVVTEPARRMAAIPESNLPAITTLDTPLRTLFVSNRHQRLALTGPTTIGKRDDTQPLTASSQSLARLPLYQLAPSLTTDDVRRATCSTTISTRIPLPLSQPRTVHPMSERQPRNLRHLVATYDSAPEPDLCASPSQPENDLLTCRDE